MLPTNEMHKELNKMERPRSCLLNTLCYMFLSFILIGVITFVIIPIIFKYSIEFQRNVIFPVWDTNNVNFSNVENFGLKGVKNFYVTVDHNENITLGAWQILPKEELSSNVTYDFEEILKKSNCSILLYLHGNGAVRSVAVPVYTVLRNYFHIIAVDYRGYGDSTKAELNEDNVVRDVVSVYKWIKTKSNARIFIWGHSLGSGISTHVTAILKNESFIPSGVILENPFSSITDVMERFFFVKLLSWLPWQRATIFDPIKENRFGFESTKYIVNVNCPIMILHAKDDSIVPYDLGTKLYETAVKNRNSTYQGDVYYHLFEARGYDHNAIYLAPELSKYISDFIQVCIDFEKKQKH